MTKYFTLKGAPIFAESGLYSRLFAVGQDLVIAGKYYEVRGCAFDGVNMYVNLRESEEQSK